VIYPKQFEEKTGFDRIRQMLKEKCLGELGHKQIDRMRFRSSFEIINKLLDQTESFRQLILAGEHFPVSNYYNPHEVFKKIRPDNTYILPEELVEIWLSLKTIDEIIKCFRKKDKNGNLSYPSLSVLAENIDINAEIFERIESIIDESGEVLNNASEELKNIRKNKSSNIKKAGNRINRILKDVKKKGLISDDLELTIRNGRQVIPLPAAHKKSIRGFVHDSSATGQTVFVEPEEVFEINNEIRELEIAEWQEIVKILTNFANFLRPHIEILKKAYRLMGIADAIRAKALLAIEMGGMKPKINPYPTISWIKAVHPLLFFSFKEQNRVVVPLDIEINEEQRILIISGPNAGGKSVCLKTCGLLQYMLQCGMLVPMAGHSETGVFNNVFIDIGDQQSLENDLSTYSSHLYNIKFFLKKADNKTLFLIDELGSGTDPAIGGAIAEASLLGLNKTKAMGVVTTHYSNLKALGGKIPGVVNGSMLFDTKNIKPIYKLKIGIPGSSFAFEIAKSINFPQSILKKAENIAGEKQVKFDYQLHDIESKKNELDEKERELRSAEVFLNEMIEKYQKLSEDYQTRKNEMIQKAREEAQEILNNTNRLIEKTIKEIRESEADKEKTKELRKEIEKHSKQIDDKLKQKHVKKEAKKEKNDYNIIPDKSPVKQGDFVRMKGQSITGEVLEVKDNNCIVLFGEIKLKTPKDKLEKVKISKGKQQNKKTAVEVKFGFDINEKAKNFKPELDIRGKKVDEALSVVRNYIDDAVLLKANEVRIIHGLGEGVLRVAIRDYLKTIPEVKKMESEHPDRGGEGVTYVFLY